MQQRHIHSLLKRFVRITVEPNDRLRPRRRIVRITARITPQNLTPGISNLARKGIVEAEKSVVNELLNLRISKSKNWFVCFQANESLSK
jgi:hypothetical protein